MEFCGHTRRFLDGSDIRYVIVLENPPNEIKLAVAIVRSAAHVDVTRNMTVVMTETSDEIMGTESISIKTPISAEQPQMAIREI